MAKTKRQLRAEAVERLNDMVLNTGSAVKKLAIALDVEWNPDNAPASMSKLQNRIADLLTDDDTHESREGYEERMYDVPVSDCPYCGCDRVVIHEYNDMYERPHSYRVEHVDEKEAFNCDCFESYYGFDSIEKAVKHADMREGERNEHPKQMYVSGEDFEWLQEQLDGEPTNGIDGETNGIADDSPLVDGDAVATMRSLRGSIDMPMIKETLCRETGTDNLIDALESLADMVERDYVSRQDFAAQHRTLCAVREQRDELKKKLGTMRDVAREFRDERDGWKAKAEAKSAKRAAAVERLKNSKYHTALDDVCAMLGWGHEPHFEGATDALIDLLTDDDAHSKAQSKTEPNLSEQSESLSDAISENLGLSQDSEIDTREKLEADVSKYVHDAWAQGWEAGQHDDMGCCNFYVADMRALLDRQAAITERQYKENYTGLGLLHDLNEYGISVKYLPSERLFTFDCSGCEWPSLAAQPDQEAYDRIAELQAKVTDLQIQLEAMSDVANDYRYERDELQERVNTLTRYIHDIKQIARKV